MLEASPIICCCQLNRPVACRECLQADFDPNPANLDADQESEVLTDFHAAQSLMLVTANSKFGAAVTVVT